MKSTTPIIRRARFAGGAGALLTAALLVTSLPGTAVAVPVTAAAAKAADRDCSLEPPAAEKSELPTGCVSADVTLDRVPAVGQEAEVTVRLDSEVAVDRAQLSIRLPQGLRISSGDFGTPAQEGLDTVATTTVALDPSGTAVTFTVTAQKAGPAQIQADVVDLDDPAVRHTAHATEEITVGTTPATSHKGVKGTRSRAFRQNGDEVKERKAAGRQKDASALTAAESGEICATGSLTYATYDGEWQPGKRFSVAVMGQSAGDGSATKLASGLTDAKDGTYELCFDHDGAPLASMWVQFATTSPYWEVNDMSGENPYVVATAPLTDVPSGTTQSFGAASPGALHMPAFDAFDVLNKVYDVRGSGTDCWTMREDQDCSRLKARWAPGNTNGGYYSLEDRLVFLTDEMPDARTPVVHEAGHNFQHLLYDWGWSNGGDCPSPHYLHRTSGPTCAWTEGFPNAIAGYVMGDGRYYYNTEAWIDLTQTGFQDPTEPPSRTNPDNGDNSEVRIAGSMIALWRELDGGPQATLRNMDTYPSDTFSEWFNTDRAKSEDLSVGKKARDILYRHTIDYRDVKRRENLVNGGLEDQGEGWTWDNGVVGSYSWEPARTGKYNAFMGGNGEAGTDRLSQSGVTIPRQGTTVLEFHLKVASFEPSGSTDDKLELQVVADGRTTTLYTWLCSDRATAYTKRVIDLSGFAGQDVTLRWVSTEDDGDRTNFLMDDFSVSTTRS
ncbi:hypothetical protein [Streptomyces coelicoflavus]|uniref:hypothetical protein n=1 Tax=Streptomyces coelicoflavus TaxID=285562 RepID=UPI0036D1E3BE